MFKDLIYISVIITLIDSIYLTSFSNTFNNIVYKIQNSKMEIKFLGVILCYIALILSLYYFIIKKNGTILDAFLLGFFIYAVFETTTYAIFKKWPFYIMVIDTIWGGILFASTIYLFNLLKNKRIVFF
tara:strand:- start:269 stop:652 length:384 start_codon:yes stop_codon:yes gene_type:complete